MIRKALAACVVLASCSCGSLLRSARFVDESQDEPNTIWICAKDTDPSNKGGLQCASVRNLAAQPVPEVHSKSEM